jgi:hypothetical protein
MKDHGALKYMPSDSPGKRYLCFPITRQRNRPKGFTVIEEKFSLHFAPLQIQSNLNPLQMHVKATNCFTHRTCLTRCGVSGKHLKKLISGD